MKQIIIYSFLSVALFIGCRKSDNPKLPNVVSVPVPLLTKDATADQVIVAQTPDLFKAKVVTNLLFKDGEKPAKFDIVVIKNGDKSNVKTIKTDVKTFPTSIDVTGIQLASLFGKPIEKGDKFDIGADVTTIGGQKFEAFPASGLGYGAGVANQPGASTSVRYEAICKFTAAAYAGNFEVLKDEWEDYANGDIVPVTVIDATHLSFKYAAANAQPIIVTVDPATNITSVTKQYYGNYGAGAEQFSAEGVKSDDNYVAPCELVLSIKLNHTSIKGNYGNFVIRLKKK